MDVTTWSISILGLFFSEAKVDVLESVSFSTSGDFVSFSPDSACEKEDSDLIPFPGVATTSIFGFDSAILVSIMMRKRMCPFY